MELQQRRTIVTGALLLSNIMAGMDGTIVNTALPAITSDLHGLQYMGWIITTFLLEWLLQPHYGVSLVSIRETSKPILLLPPCF